MTLPKELRALAGDIPGFDEAAAARARTRWDSIAKPLGSLGLLEDAVARIAGATGDAEHRIDRRLLLVCCADNGVVRRGVTQTDSSVTAKLARALARGELSVCKMAALARADILGIDLGMAEDPQIPQTPQVENFLSARIAAGTADIAEGPAMSRAQALAAIATGAAAARRARGQGYGILATGELGIGNTTTSSALASVLLRLPPAEVTGRGAGLSTEGLRRKIAVIEQAVRVNAPDPDDPLDILSKLGGFDIAGLTGVFLGAAAARLPVLIDGLISSVAALIAKRLCPAAAGAMIASHVSSEPAARRVLAELGLRPLLTAEMRLGEGSGAVAVLPVLDMACAVYHDRTTFDALSIEQYKPQIEDGEK